MSIFSVPQKNIIVEVIYTEKEGNIIFINDKTMLKDEVLEKLKTAKAEFAYESWEEFNKLMKQSIVKDPISGEASLDHMLLRDFRLRKLLKKITDGDGNEIIINDKEISGWSPEFCLALMNAYFKSTENILVSLFKEIE